MIKHYAFQGYISRQHKMFIDSHGWGALQLCWIKDDLGDFEPHQLPAYRVEGAFDIDEAERGGIWTE